MGLINRQSLRGSNVVSSRQFEHKRLNGMGQTLDLCRLAIELIRDVRPIWAGNKVYLMGVEDMDDDPWILP